MVVLLLTSYFSQQWFEATDMALMRTQLLGVAINLVAVLSYLLFFWPRYVGERPYVSRSWFSVLLVCMGMIGVFMWVLPHLPGAAK
jgi:hypothetical protein